MVDVNLLKLQLGDDQDMKLLTGNHKDGLVLMVVSKNTGNVDMSLAVEHHMLCALKCLHLPSHKTVDAQLVSDLCGVTLLDDAVATAVILT